MHLFGCNLELYVNFVLVPTVSGCINLHLYPRMMRVTFGSGCTDETELGIAEAQQLETKRSLFDFSTSPGVCIITLLDKRRVCEL